MHGLQISIPTVYKPEQRRGEYSLGEYTGVERSGGNFPGGGVYLEPAYAPIELANWNILRLFNYIDKLINFWFLNIFEKYT